MKRLHCPTCGKGPFKNGAGLAGHRQFMHGDVERKYFVKNEVQEALDEIKKKLDLILERMK